MDWALRSCSRQRHETYAPDESAFRERLQIDTAVGQAWRCLRRGAFVPGPARRSGPASASPEVPHGKLRRDRWIMRLLAVERVLRALVIAAVAVAVFRFRGSKESFRAVFDEELPLAAPARRPDRLEHRRFEDRPVDRFRRLALDDDAAPGSASDCASTQAYR